MMNIEQVRYSMPGFEVTRTDKAFVARKGELQVAMKLDVAEHQIADVIRLVEKEERRLNG